MEEINTDFMEHPGLVRLNHRVIGFILETPTTRNHWVFPQTAVSYVKDFSCHIGTTSCFRLFGFPGLYIYKYIELYVCIFFCGAVVLFLASHRTRS